MEEQRLEQLRLASVDSDKDQKREGIASAARGFESMFVSMLFRQMKESMLNTDNEEEEGDLSFGGETLDGLVNMQFGDHVANSGKGIGIAEAVYRSMTGESMPATSLKTASIVSGDRAPDASEFLRRSEGIDNLKRPAAPTSLQFENARIPMSIQRRLEQYSPLIKAAAARHNVPEALVSAVISAESGAKADATSRVGAKGLMQLMDGTAKDMGVNNAFDPAENIEGGTKYLRQMLSRFDGNVELALAAYNAGPGNVTRYGMVPPFKETQAYVKRVRRYFDGLQGADL